MIEVALQTESTAKLFRTKAEAASSMPGAPIGTGGPIVGSGPPRTGLAWSSIDIMLEK